jgi:predicted ATPase
MTELPNHNNRLPRCKVVLTGGPGGGKTTAADLFRRELGSKVVVVPETATMLFSGGFPRSDNPTAKRSAQTAIYQVQRNLENIHTAMYPGRVLLCDRGTVDGGAYWPGEPEDFFASLGTTLDDELNRYDEVIFFETAAVGGLRIEGGNPTRCESDKQAVELDKRLREMWSAHHRFTFIAHDESFIKKVNAGLKALARAVADFDPQHAP